MESGKSDKSGKTSLFPVAMPPASTKEKQLIAIGAFPGRPLARAFAHPPDCRGDAPTR